MTDPFSRRTVGTTTGIVDCCDGCMLSWLVAQTVWMLSRSRRQWSSSHTRLTPCWCSGGRGLSSFSSGSCQRWPRWRLLCRRRTQCVTKRGKKFCHFHKPSKCAHSRSPLSLPQSPFSRSLRSTIGNPGHPHPMRTLRITNGGPERATKWSLGEREVRSCKQYPLRLQWKCTDIISAVPSLSSRCSI